ncbi:hypothetical protein N7476_007895 [Penicillium atrosanguineum]|uniref:RNA polymerase-associated protein LEO1 n=1 Tax=Penicillium atrosanguineum TaxID=1132637 RepID=A0A9W9PTS9_9EURO|nr:hypothetical protein N7476_007895 [Penicillium atrosanguineum]
MSDSEEDAVRRSGRAGASHQSPAPSDNGSNGDDKDLFGDDQMDEDNDADLFGSEDEDGGADNNRAHRTLDDEQLDSGDDDNRYDRRDRMDEAADDDGFGETVNIMDVGLARAPVPATNDGQVYTVRVPDFLSVESEEFNPETYVAPPYSTAATSLCWRKDPNDETQLQSNARFIQWEDGSITLQLASAPQEQYTTSLKPLAPLSKSGEYNTKLDSHVYLGAAVETASVFRLTSHVTHGMTIQPTTLESDDAVQRLQESLALAARGSKQTADGTAPLIDTKVDPEMAARKAELMEKDAMKAERRRQQLEDREADRTGRRAAASRPMASGLSVGDLESGGMRTTRPQKRRPNRRGEIYSDDEEDYGRGARSREDEYDEDDGFLVGSDEEEEVVDDDDEEELMDDDIDAEGEADEDAAPAKPRSKPVPREGTPPARKKNRYVVDDDDEDE